MREAAARIAAKHSDAARRNAEKASARHLATHGAAAERAAAAARKVAAAATRAATGVTVPGAPAAPPGFVESGLSTASGVPIRRLYRRTDDRVLGGVASGIAEHVGARPLVVRLVFLVLLAFGGLGAVLYAVFWAVLAIDPAAEQRGRRRDTGQLVAFVVFGLGIIVVLLGVGGNSQLVLVWCLGVVAVGAALVWRRADPVQRQRWVAAAPQVPWLGPVLAGGRGMMAVRLLGGGVLVMVGLVGFLVFSGEWESVRDGLLFGGVLLAGVALVLAPWLAQIIIELRAERSERIRSQERAEIAAMVHDQVLHTLALIQRRSADPREVARLARGQERSLRNWLYKPTASAAERIGAALEEAAAEVEDAFAVSVDAVVVGDCALDPGLTALVQASREALVNAGKHAGVASVSLYAEIEPDQVSVFIRDRGRGFDPKDVDDDRHGVRGSILGRMERHGGKAEIRSSPGSGTEVRLTMKRTNGD
ncbi:PspC domain-containing protein [Cryptosporangium phraense]|uniref:PspC domain-containing protein n=1 Tax=Cryptosporangium phraense TaxID=2593070 RepID=A0A545AZC7_9ACTN|nr:PspC domain-containing protein [Cryptosporangium phraense]